MEFDYKDLVTNLSEGLYIVDTNRKINFWNNAAKNITGYASKEVTGSSCADNILVHVDDKGNNLCRGMCPLAKTMEDGKPRTANVYLHHKKGHRLPVSIKVISLKNLEGKIIGGAELFSDISDQKIKDTKLKELQNLAFIDTLTRVANRNYINLELENKFFEAKQHNNRFGILFFDIDHFKIFNDNYGHEIGDKVLYTVANTLKSNSRPFDTIGRWGGEEFIVILHNTNREQLFKLGERFRILIKKSMIVHKGQNLNVSASMGGTISQERDSVDSIIARADKLMYKSKSEGRDRLSIG
ncbi:MAG: sensor domain-containing diguanylate cyclase [Victivallales bacterium]|nr:sensor domain-containing diguanylate cyclase [Victivallales bacterium]